jgi:hypothetical protein
LYAITLTFIDVGVNYKYDFNRIVNCTEYSLRVVLPSVPTLTLRSDLKIVERLITALRKAGLPD